MKKIITTLTAVTFVLGLAAAVPAQVAKTPEKPAVQSTQTVQPQVAPKEAPKPVEPVVKDTVATGDKAKEAAKTADQGKAKKEAKKAVKKGAVEKKAGANPETTPKDAK